jgi:hypothetical protein
LQKCQRKERKKQKGRRIGITLREEGKQQKQKKQGKSENSLGKGFRQQMHMVRRERRN